MRPFPLVFPGLPYASPNTPSGAPGHAPVTSMAQTASGVSLGAPSARSCMGCPSSAEDVQLRDVAPDPRFPMWAKVLAALAVVGAVIAIVRVATR